LLLKAYHSTGTSVGETFILPITLASTPYSKGILSYDKTNISALDGGIALSSFMVDNVEHKNDAT
jgi:hypothetical protein